MPYLFDSAPPRSLVIDVIVVPPTPNMLTLSRRNLTIVLICSEWIRQQHLGQKPIVLRNLIRYNRPLLDTQC